MRATVNHNCCNNYLEVLQEPSGFTLGHHQLQWLTIPENTMTHSNNMAMVTAQDLAVAAAA